MREFQSTPLGVLGLEARDGAICALYFNDEGVAPDALGSTADKTLLAEAFKQLREYCERKRTVFDLPLRPHGTAFMQQVWQALQTIPYGSTASYKDIAVRVANPKAFRAVGMANNKNPIGIIIPCHRVIGADGSLVGYAGGLEFKKKLLDFEAGRIAL